MLYDKRLRRGFLYDKLRNLNRNRTQCLSDDEHGDEEGPENSETSLLSYLRTCVVKDQLNELKKKLTESVTIRRKHLRKGMVEIKSMFPFYFADPRLVCILIIDVH